MGPLLSVVLYRQVPVAPVLLCSFFLYKYQSQREADGDNLKLAALHDIVQVITEAEGSVGAQCVPGGTGTGVRSHSVPTSGTSRALGCPGCAFVDI